MTQEQAVIDYMKARGSITSMDAFHDLRITRLSAIIFNIKKHGYRVDMTREIGINNFGNLVSYARYTLNGRY